MKEALRETEIPFSAGAVLISVGVVYGDIGTSPMYVMKSIIAGNGGIAQTGRMSYMVRSPGHMDHYPADNSQICADCHAGGQSQ
ncbi:MAG: KUP/HAK/KT family potassium transporter [Blautia marasmi]